MNLADIFRGINQQMLIDFEFISKQVQHRASKGKIRESEIINEYLTKYIPWNIGASSGEIISSDDQTSHEVDIVLYEKNSTPYLYKTDNYQIFPIECVYGIIEVKSLLDKKQLEDSLVKISAVKKMPKVAYRPSSSLLRSIHFYDKDWPYFPTFGIVIAFDSIQLHTLRDHLNILQNDLPFENKIDAVYILKKGMLINLNHVNGGVDFYPSSQSTLRILESDNPLISLTMHLQSLCLSAWTPRFDLQKYLKETPTGTYLG